MPIDMLVMNCRGSSWDFIPDEMWYRIIQRFAARICDSVSFDSIMEAADVSQLTVFAEYVPTYLRQASYKPLSVPCSVPNPDTYEQPVAVFQFDEWVARLVLQQPFNCWHLGNEGASVDELVFWTGDCIKLHAIPYEGFAYFHNLTHDERQCLLRADKRVESNLYSV